MLSFPGGPGIYLAIEPYDMRKSFNGLHVESEGKLIEIPQDGALIVSTNKRCNRIKLPYFDGPGLWILANNLAPQSALWFGSEDPVSAPPPLRRRL